MRMIAAGLIVVAILASAAIGAPRAATTRSATSPPPDPLIEEAVSAIEAGRLAAFTRSVEKSAADVLAKPESADLARLTQLATLRELGRWFGRVEQPSAEQKATLAWLVRQRRLAPTLLLSATNFDPPDRVLSILTALRQDQRDRLERLPNLTTAVCLVWDDPDRFGGEGDDGRPIDLPRVVRVFKDYADHPAADLPVDLMVFVVDCALAEGETEWVRGLSAAPDVGEAFFEVGYGPTRDLKRDARPDEPQNAYTLPNLRKFGGRIADQSYYAAQVGKAAGVPTAICTGPQREGLERESWVAFYDARGQWDVSSARYRVHHASPGEAIDPQSMESLPQGELSLITDARSSSSAKRLAATALCKLLDRVPPEQQFAALKRAVELSPSDRRVWRRVADWAQQHRPASDEYRSVSKLISAHLQPRSEDAALHIRLRILAKVAADDRARAFAELSRDFDGRQDLAATIQLARATALLEKKDADGALSALAEVVTAADVIPAHAASAMRMADDILRERSDLDRLADVYARVWPRMRPPTQSPVAHTTAYWSIGQEYAQLLEELGRKNDVENVREKLSQLWAEPVKR